MTSVGILWAQYGPYHFARVSALRRLAVPTEIHALEMADRTTDYAWRRGPEAKAVVTLCPNAVYEQLPFQVVFWRTRQKVAELGLSVCFLPSYAPKQSLAALLAVRSLGVRAIMMNDSHAGTARAYGLAAMAKRGLVRLFHAALVAGKPQKRYFASLGLPDDKIFTGYDAIDNVYFARRAEEVRNRASEFRKQYGLPEHFFLSLGRFVPKKNLGTLLHSYNQFLRAGFPNQTHLVIVGSGEEEPQLRALCAQLGLPTWHHDDTNSSGTRNPVLRAPQVHFYGFRQIDESPVFYALADAFVLPSLYEEWGLVVNEAMASGLPVVVSETAGCAEDLLEAGWPSNCCQSPASLRVRQLGLETRLRQNGLVFAPESSQELSRILSLLDDCPDLRHAMSKASRRIVNKYSCENFARNALLAAQAALGQMPAAVRLCRSTNPA